MDVTDPIPTGYYDLGWSLEGDGVVNLYSAPEFVVGIGLDPLPFSDAVLLASHSVLVNGGTEAIWWRVRGADNGGTLRYGAGDDSSNLVDLYPVCGEEFNAGLNADPCEWCTFTGNEASTWGQLKALYR